MAQIARVPLSGGRQAWVDYGWTMNKTGSVLTITLEVEHPTATGLTIEDQLGVLEAVRDAIPGFSHGQ